MKEWTIPDSQNTPSTRNLEEEEIVDAPGNGGNASMPEQVKRPNPWRKMMMMVYWNRQNTPEKKPMVILLGSSNIKQKRNAKTNSYVKNLKLRGVLIQFSPTKVIANYKLVPPK